MERTRLSYQRSIAQTGGNNDSKKITFNWNTEAIQNA